MLIDFKDEDFHSKVKNEEVSILQFSASWCQPCKILKPIMEKLSEEYKDKVNFYYADIDEKAINTATSIAGVRGVPTVVIYKKGVEVARKVGGVPENHMRDFLKTNIYVPSLSEILLNLTTFLMLLAPSFDSKLSLKNL